MNSKRTANLFRRLLVLAALLVPLIYVQSNKASQSTRQLDFNRDIQPILAAKCWICHGPDAADKKIRLRLDSKESAMADLGRGRHAIVPGEPSASELVKRITSDKELVRMPPASSGRTLTQSEIELLTEWIKQGAKWQVHWSFVSPERPDIPAVRNKAWLRNSIDNFVLAQLEQKGINPSPEANRAALIRRVTFDLTGLPPTLDEVDAFLNDRSPNAYEKVVDRLLASPRYGERMAFRWLDAARYADTNGYQLDGERNMWRWRDWVIEAFNRNIPFDQFVIEQLAGDLLPAPSLDQRIATGFNRNHRTNSEDGIVPAEYAVEYVVDRVDTISTVFMGLTTGCARCHNHKYDPITQREYYQLFAYFNSIPEYGRVSNFGNAPPWIFAPDREQQASLRSLEGDIAAARRQLEGMIGQSAAARKQWESTLTASSMAGNQWFPNDDLLVRHALDQSAALETHKPKQNPHVPQSDVGFREGKPDYVDAPTGQGAKLDGRAYFDAGPVANFDYRDRLHDFKDRFAISVWIYPEADSSGAIVTRMRDVSGTVEKGLPTGRGYGLFFIDGKVHFNLVSVWADDSFRAETESRLPVNKWCHVLATFDSLEPEAKVQIYINGQKQRLNVNQPYLFRQFADSGGRFRIGGGGGGQFRFKGAIDELRVYETLPGADERAILACADTLSSIAAIPSQKRTAAQNLKLAGAWLDTAAPAAVKEAHTRLRVLEKRKTKLESSLPTVMVMQEAPAPNPAYVLKRGAYDARGEQVSRGVPGVLPTMPGSFPANRLGLARWLVSRDHPLTARVQVNRFWQMLFGTGLVKTVEDFGTRGELPSHPELLDWLATEFMQGSWNVKALLKTIAMSATYRQSSRITPELERRDPENRWLARGARVRLPAEMVRDSALFDAGLLVERLGGPSVRPYQPEGLYKDMVFSNMTAYGQDKGDGLWRRSLYTFWKRTILAPSMLVMDASPREFCTVREPRTNSPLQALNLMNDVTYVEAARVLAQRILIEGGKTPSSRVAWGFRLVTSRTPDAMEQNVLVENLKGQLEHYRSNPQDAKRLLSIGEKPVRPDIDQAELASYAMLASMLLNLDEAITKQ